MKKVLRKMFFVLFVLIILSGCGSSPETAQGKSLDTAIQEAAESIEARLEGKTKIALLNFSSTSEQLSQYVLDELSANLVNSGKLVIVDRKEIDLIRSETDFQLSGEVSDESAQEIGKMLGAQSIVSGSLANIGDIYRINVKVITVQSAEVTVQYRSDIANDSKVKALLASGGGAGSGSAGRRTARGGSSGTASSGTATGETVTTPTVIEPLITGTMVPGASLTEKLAWLQRSAESHNTYILEANADENIAPQTLEYRGAINITIALRGDDANRTIRLRSNGTMFTVGSNVTFVLDNNITLQGHNGNGGVMVLVKDGTFKMNVGSAIISNHSHGVLMEDGTTFAMSGGTISGNGGAGVLMRNDTTFTMSGGIISGNNNGGVNMNNVGGNFTMSGGIISGNTARQGGGVRVGNGGSFTMSGGSISGNTARESGGGVYVDTYGNIFRKTGNATITGYGSDPDNGNIVKDDTGPLARLGHAVFCIGGGGLYYGARKETTAGSGVNLFYDGEKNSGPWDN
ncbi:hypothetical protein FACS189498_2710 [Spirochaetia bacterium]|nr:hypothetical protein FACS189498_2710 [Spirochaetia bacterium]